MLELFSLIKEEFSQEYNENWWTYAINFEFIFNKQIINYITITDYIWKDKKGREMITKELILELLSKINGEILEPMEYEGDRNPYEWEITCQKPYRLFFWFKDGTNNHLWIRNCHRID